MHNGTDDSFIRFSFSTLHHVIQIRCSQNQPMKIRKVKQTPAKIQNI